MTEQEIKQGLSSVLDLIILECSNQKGEGYKVISSLAAAAIDKFLEEK